MNIVECPEFRRLIRFLRQDIKESDVPHRMKIRNVILELWKENFEVLRAKLTVSIQLLIVQII